jgi:hypothetical protein
LSALETTHDLLKKVHDRESFIAFASALAEERSRVEEIEKKEQNPYSSPQGWQNSEISSFLFAALCYFESNEEPAPSWKMMAEFLYFGKIIE